MNGCQPLGLILFVEVGGTRKPDGLQWSSSNRCAGKYTCPGRYRPPYSTNYKSDEGPVEMAGPVLMIAGAVLMIVGAVLLTVAEVAPRRKQVRRGHNRGI